MISKRSRGLLPTPASIDRPRKASTMKKCADFRKRNANQNTVPLYLGEAINDPEYQMEAMMLKSRLLQSPMPSDASGGRTTKGKRRQNETGLRRQLLRTPSSQEPGITTGRLVTKDGEPARVGERAYDAMTGRLVQQGLTQQINYSSPPDSLASPSVALDEDAERTMTATSGRRLWQSSPQPGPIGCCLRMLLESSRWYSPIVRLEWQAKPLFSKVRMTKSQTMTPSLEESTGTSDKQGMRPFGCLYQLAVSERRIDETGCGLLPTPKMEPSGPDYARQNRDGSGGDDLVTKITMLAGDTAPTAIHHTPPQVGSGQKGTAPTVRGLLPQMLTTPNCNDAREVPPDLRPSRYETGRTTDYLSRQIAMLPTPDARAWKSGVGRQENGHAPQLEAVLESQDGKRTGMKLQPAFVEWMMGYPESWTELPGSKPSGTP